MTAVATILTIGDELMLGDRIDTNGPWLSRALLQRGITIIERRTVHDRVNDIALAITELAQRSEILIISGGLGPTEDDRTRRALAVAMKEQLVHNQCAHDSIKEWFVKRGADMPPANDVQALAPTTARWIPNANGTAPGLHASIGTCNILCLPGPPAELQPMYVQEIEALTVHLSCGNPLTTTEVHAWGLSEAVAGSKITTLMQEKDPIVALLISQQGVTARVTSECVDKVGEVVAEIEKRWSPWVYGRGAQSLAFCIGELLKHQGGTLATAESCTGGFMGELVVDPAGASDWYRGGWVTYSNALKVEQLSVLPATLDKYGAVSSAVAAEMCVGASARSGASCTLSTTGIAGPTGGSTAKPVGTVFIGCLFDGVVEVRQFRFSGNRLGIRRRAAYTALQMLRLKLVDAHVAQMCWQYDDTVQC